jgi:multiple sugar transport system permease protein
MTPRGWIPKVAVYLVLAVLSVIFAFPMAWLLVTALKPETLIFQYPPVWIFPPTLDHVRSVVTGDVFHFKTHLANSLFVCEMVILGTVLSCSMGAYSLALVQWRWKGPVFVVMLATMMLPAQVTMIPVFVLFKQLGWVNTFLPLVVPAFLGSPFFIFLLRQFFLTVPRDLVDAATVDGCGHLRIWWQIVLPLSKPALATVGLFSFLGAWNDFMGPLVYLLDEKRYTLSLALAMFKNQYDTQYGPMMAASALMTLPIIVLFFFTQRTFIQGVKMTGIKG